MITAAFSLNAQIFINTNPNSKGDAGTVVKETTKVDEAKKELHTTTTKTEEYKTKVTSPNYKAKTNDNIRNSSPSYNKNSYDASVGKTSVKTSTTNTGTTINAKNTGTTVSSTNTGTSTNSTKVTGVRVNANNSNVSGTTSRTTSTVRTASTRTTTSTPSTYSGSNADVPPNAVPGKCYARCQTDDQYSFNTKQVINSPKMTRRIKLPALYSTVYDTVIVRPQSTRTENIPAQYETIRQQKMVSPTTTKWVKGKADAGCLSANPNDCQVMCLVEVPAQYTTVTKKVLKHQSYTRAITIPMEFKIVAKQVRTQNERYTEQVVPATYKTVQERVLVKKGGYQGWREILCGSDLTTSKISAIQRALKSAGYNPGPIDNVFGTQTKEALKSYQRAKGLPVGNLNLETLRSLGV